MKPNSVTSSNGQPPTCAPRAGAWTRSKGSGASRSRSSAWPAATPAGSELPEELWQLVAAGRDAISAFPTDRGWDLEGLYDPDPDHPGTSYAREGGFLADAGDFDAELLRDQPARGAGDGPPAAAAAGSCPGRRFEDAGIDPGSLAGHADRGLRRDDAPRLRPPAGRSPTSSRATWRPGSRPASLSGRIAYSLGLEGPAMTVDTACSSSLVTLHLAAQALRAGECSLALAGGVDGDGHARACSSSSHASAASPPTAAASPSPRPPTAPASRRASGCSSWSGSPTRSETATGSSP